MCLTMKNRICLTSDTNPFKNLACERLLLESVQEEEVILYLWQNEKTVVIGKNQNIWKEVNLNALKQDHGTAVRRLSGGGAVFHDLGNLNFTFLMRKANVDLDKQFSVIIEALKSFGLDAKKSGRNDLEIDGYKFSGNAFYESKGHCYHHGTLLVAVNMEHLSKYLNVSKEKLKSKSVNSVRSRVKNLNQFCSDITIDSIQKALVQSFEKIYGKAERIEIQSLNQDQLETYEQQFRSWDWLYGRAIPFDHEIQKRFVWGEIMIQLHVNKGIIEDLNVYSDSLDPHYIDSIAHDLVGCAYEADTMIRHLQEHAYKQDIANLIRHSLMEENYD